MKTTFNPDLAPILGRVNHIIMAFLALAVGFGVVPPAPAQTRSLDKVIAVADEEVILQSEFDQRLAQVQQQLLQQGGPRAPTAAVRKQVLDQLILEKLQLQMAQRGGIRVDDNMLNEVLANMAQENNLTFDQFRQALEQQGVYRQTRDAIAKEITLNQLRSRAVNSRINISRQEIENYLRSETGQSALAPEYHVAHILIPTSDDGFENRREELAKLLYQAVRDGEDIANLTRSSTIAGISVSGGDLGWRKAEALPSVFTDRVPNMKPGEVSEPFTSSSGRHIVKLLETRGGTNLIIQQTHVRHILIKPNEIRTDEQSERLIHDLYERIMNGEDFASIARQHTDDPNSMVSGGDLDWVTEGQLPADFMTVINDTPIGQVTEPFRVEDGWHICEVLERRERDITEENARFRAQQELRQRKFDLELENWLTEMRDTAYVDIKDETLK